MTHASQATATDGTRIAYAISGNPRASRRVALVHALAMSGSFWNELLANLPEDLAILTIDCRGHGASDKPEGPYTAQLFASDLAAALDDAGWDKAVIGGASMGGCVAQAFAQAYPARTLGLALIDTTAWYGDGAPEAWEGRAQKAVDGGMSALIGFQKTRWFGDAFREANPDKVQALIDIFLRNDIAAYVETCRMLGNCDLRAGLDTMSMPVEIVVGDEDYATPPEMAAAMQAALPRANMTILPGVRHFSPVETPAETLAAIDRLFAAI